MFTQSRTSALTASLPLMKPTMPAAWMPRALLRVFSPSPQETSPSLRQSRTEAA